jgi:DNA helicase-2/ATP-dependent DNA helicase PcrA
MRDLSAGLNDSQRTAVEWRGGPLLVLAGPGSGKTRVLTLRIAHIIESSRDARFKVLGITFTNRAAAEMRKRVDALVGEGRDRVNITTFHSFAAEILRQHGSHVGLRPDFAIISDTADREALLNEAITGVRDQLGADEPVIAAKILPVITRALDACVRPENMVAWLANASRAASVPAVFRAYREHLIRSNQLDFPSLLSLSVDLLETQPMIAHQLQRVYSHVCVDEFQDTNAAQARLLKQVVSPKRPNLFIVADGDQTIYEWNGASPARLADIKREFGMSTVELPENFRCPPEVVSIANQLIQHNDDRDEGKQPLRAHKPAGDIERVTLHRFADFEAEARWIAQHIAEGDSDRRAETVVLARRRRILDAIVDSLNDAGIAAYVAVRKNEFESAPFRWLHALLRLANARSDRDQLRRVCASYYSLEGIRIEPADVVAAAALAEGDLLRSWTDFASTREATEVMTRDVLRTLRATLVDRLEYRPFVVTATTWFHELASLKKASAAPVGFEDYDVEDEIWRALDEDIRSQVGSDLPVHAFLQELDLRAKERPNRPDAIRCFTIHASKGMEFKHVVMPAIVEDELPSWAAKRKGDRAPEMREERRSCFVAITRTEESLTFTYARNYWGHVKQPSRFLLEMGLSAQ